MLCTAPGRISDRLAARIPRLFLLSLALGACEFDKGRLLAPSDAQLSLTAARSLLVAEQTTELTIRASRPDGGPVADGTEVLISAEIGQLEQLKVRTRNGLAMTTYRAASTVARDRLVAVSGNLRAELTLAIASGEVARLELAADPPVLPASGGTTAIIATARTDGGTPVHGAPVVFAATAGTISPTQPVYTDEQGQARATLTTNAPATVSASVLEVRSELPVRLRDPVRLTLSASPSEPSVNWPVTFTILAARTGGEPAVGMLAMLFGDGQQRDLGQITGSAVATHTYTQVGTFTATARLTESDGAVSQTTLSVRVKEGPPGPAPPGTPLPNVDMIDPASITWLHPASTNVSNWKVTSHLYKVEIEGHRICLHHTKAGQWPPVSIDDNPPNIEGNPMIVVNIGGRWYGAGFDWFGVGRVCKTLPPEEYGRDQIRVPPLDHTWPGPRSGEVYGFLVSTPSSNRIPVRSVNERTNIVLVRWP